MDLHTRVLGTLVILHSLGRMQPRLPYALLAQVVRDDRVETAVSDGPTRVGYVMGTRCFF